MAAAARITTSVTTSVTTAMASARAVVVAAEAVGRTRQPAGGGARVRQLASSRAQPTPP